MTPGYQKRCLSHEPASSRRSSLAYEEGPTLPWLVRRWHRQSRASTRPPTASATARGVVAADSGYNRIVARDRRGDTVQSDARPLCTNPLSPVCSRDKPISRTGLAFALLPMLTMAAACGSGGGSADPGVADSDPGIDPGLRQRARLRRVVVGLSLPRRAARAAARTGSTARSGRAPRRAGVAALPEQFLEPAANRDPGYQTLDGPGNARCASTSTAGSVAPRTISGSVRTTTSPARPAKLGRRRPALARHQLHPQLPGGANVGSVVDGAVRDGSMTILVDVRGVDDPRNDDEVEVQVFSSRDAPPLGGDGSVLPYGTLSVDPDARYQSSGRHGTHRERRRRSRGRSTSGSGSTSRSSPAT